MLLNVAQSRHYNRTFEDIESDACSITHHHPRENRPKFRQGDDGIGYTGAPSDDSDDDDQDG